MHRITRGTVLGTVCSLVLMATAYAQVDAKVTLTRDSVLWDEPAEARIEGRGCVGKEIHGPDVVALTGDRFGIDIGIGDCDLDHAKTFSVVVPIDPPLYPNIYIVRVFDDDRGTLITTANLTVHRRATADIVVPETPTNGPTGVTIVFRGPAKPGCFSFNAPTVKGHVISASFADLCTNTALGGRLQFQQDYVFDLDPGAYEVRLFELTGGGLPRMHRETFVVHDENRCLPSDTTLCLADGRFKVQVQWTNFQGQTGPGHSVPLADRGDSGLFWFFGPENVELTLKILNGCTLNNRRWVFLSSGTTVGFTMTVTDTVTHAVKTYTNAPGQSAPLRADTDAFACGGS